MAMLASEVLARFEKRTPLTVQSRVLLEYALAPDKLDALFRDVAVNQYERELLFSTTLAVMTDVVLATRPSVRQSFLERKEQEEITVSLSALYSKLNNTETGTSEALVRHSYQQLYPVVVAMNGLKGAWHDKYAVKIIDGSCVEATEHRLAVLRGTHAGPLPGKGLVIYDPPSELIEEVILCEDGHAQERSLFERWLEKIQQGQLWLADRNFCTAEVLFTIHDKGARFVIRQHATNAPWESAGPSKCLGRIDTGTVYEQSVRLVGENERKLLIRRVTLVLDVPTRDGETETPYLHRSHTQRIGRMWCCRNVPPALDVGSCFFASHHGPAQRDKYSRISAGSALRTRRWNPGVQHGFDDESIDPRRAWPRRSRPAQWLQYCSGYCGDQRGIAHRRATRDVGAGGDMDCRTDGRLHASSGPSGQPRTFQENHSRSEETSASSNRCQGNGPCVHRQAAGGTSCRIRRKITLKAPGREAWPSVAWGCLSWAHLDAG